MLTQAFMWAIVSPKLPYSLSSILKTIIIFTLTAQKWDSKTGHGLWVSGEKMLLTTALPSVS